MAKSDDGGFTPTTFTKTDERGEHELVANSPADAVRLRFDGWREKKTNAGRPGNKPAGASS
jgi:hypothetical protein